MGEAASEDATSVTVSVDVVESVGKEGSVEEAEYVSLAEPVEVSTMVELGSNVGVGTTSEKLLYVYVYEKLNDGGVSVELTGWKSDSKVGGAVTDADVSSELRDTVDGS